MPFINDCIKWNYLLIQTKISIKNKQIAIHQKKSNKINNILFPNFFSKFASNKNELLTITTF